MWRYISILLRCLTPFRVIIGVTCLTISCVIQASVLITSAERLLRSRCGVKCGHLLVIHKFFNPLDSLLVHLSSVLGKVFGIRLHVDDLIVLVLLGYLYVCCFFGLVKLGISETCLSFWNTRRTSYSYLFRIRKRGSFPQALTVAAAFTALIMYHWYQSLSLYLPNYFTFVHQMKSKAAVNTESADGYSWCEFDHPLYGVEDLQRAVDSLATQNCHLTRMSVAGFQRQLDYPFLSMVTFFLGTCASVVTFITFLVYHAAFKKTYNSSALGMLQGQYGGGVDLTADYYGNEEQDEVMDFLKKMQGGEKHDESKAKKGPASLTVYEGRATQRREFRDEMVVTQWQNQDCWDNQSYFDSASSRM